VLHEREQALLGSSFAAKPMTSVPHRPQQSTDGAVCVFLVASHSAIRETEAQFRQSRDAQFAPW
jgi:hypothetical protein